MTDPRLPTMENEEHSQSKSETQANDKTGELIDIDKANRVNETSVDDSESEWMLVKSEKATDVFAKAEDEKADENTINEEERQDQASVLGEQTEEQEEEAKPSTKEKVITRQSTAPLYHEPAFAEVCSFFNTFGTSLGLRYSIERLEKVLCTHVNGKVDPELIDLHLFLMRRIRLNWARADKFDLCLERYCQICPALDSEELELKRFDYVDLPTSAKLTILKALCESQFDFNYKFKETIFNTFSHAELRLAPIGYDRNGCAFYFQQDYELSLRVYSFELDDQSGASWTLRARSSKELYRLIEDLKSNDYGTKKETESDDEELDEIRIVENVVKPEFANKDMKDPHDYNEFKLEMSDAEQEKIQMTTKRHTLWDMFQVENQLNKKQKQKEERRKNRETEKAEQKVVKKAKLEVEDDVKSEKSADEKAEEPEEVEEDLSEFMDDRRILPRRSARNVAINNLKQFTAPTRKRNPAELKKKDDKQEFGDETAALSDSDVFDESDEEEEEIRTSDDEFVGPRSMRKRKGRKRKSGVPKKAKSTSLIPRKRPPKLVAFDEESTSDEDDEEVKHKERKKANEKTLCMKCRGSKRPDVLLLCDMCDDAWHTFCLRPVLHFVPDGDWFCPRCHHQMLIQKLSYSFIQHQKLQRSKEEEEQRKALEAERINRERRQNGIDLKNIISQQNQYDLVEQLSSEGEDIDDGQRKSKRRALKRVLKRSRRDNHNYQRDFYLAPVVTIAEGRSRRNLHKVDYNFQAYDDQLQEAMDAIDSPPAQSAYERPTGLGRGKDMATILEAEERRGSLDEDEEVVENLNHEQQTSTENCNQGEISPKKTNGKNEIDASIEAKSLSAKSQQRKSGRPPANKKKSKKNKRLTDLDLDNATESDTDEYQASSDEQEEEEDISSEEEYVPSDAERQRGRGGTGRGANYYSRTRSDDEFINDEDSDSDFEPKKRKTKAGQKRKSGKGRGGRKTKRSRKWSDSEEESDEESEDEEYQSESSEDERTKRRSKSSKAAFNKPARKWEPKGSSDEEEETEEVEDEEGFETTGPTTQAGRPLRRAATEMKKKMDELEKQGAEIDHEVEDEEEVGEGNKAEKKTETDVSKIIGQPRKRTAKAQNDEEDEFEPNEAESNSEESAADEQIEEELARELAEKKQQRQRRQIQSDEEGDEKRKQKMATAVPILMPKASSQKSGRGRPPASKAFTDNGAMKLTAKRPEKQEIQRNSTPEDPTPPVQIIKRGPGRRKSDALVSSKSPPKSAGRKSRQSTSAQQALPISLSKMTVPTHSTAQPLQQLEQMRPLVHHPTNHPITASVAYIVPQQSVAYALPPHVRPSPGIHYVQPHSHVMPPSGYDYYSAPPPQYLHGHPPPGHVYPPPPAHLIGNPTSSYQVYSMPYEQQSNQPQVTQLQTMRPVDPDSLGHALAGAMNPDAL